MRTFSPPFEPGQSSAHAKGQGRYVALFRAVNVGGHAKVAMADLRAMAGTLDLQQPRTVLQTGNLIFETDGPTSGLEARLEKAASESLGLTSDVIVRSAADWDALVVGNPFPAEARDNPARLVILVLKNDPAQGAQAALEAASKGRDTVCVQGRSAYVVFPDGIGRSKLTLQMLERHLGSRATGRNWRTVEKIAAALSS